MTKNRAALMRRLVQLFKEMQTDGRLVENDILFLFDKRSDELTQRDEADLAAVLSIIDDRASRYQEARSVKPEAAPIMLTEPLVIEKVVRDE